jgi:hypothetical protein
MLEHDCHPNVEFSSQWIHESDAADGSLCTEDDQLVSMGSTLLRASSARSASHSLVLTLRTLRTVAAGESLSISYYPCRVRTAIRQTHLRNQYGFSCECSRCEGVDDTRAFHCCYPAMGASDTSSIHETTGALLPRRCPGVMAPRGLGQSPASFQCALCHRTLRTEAQYRSVCEWEQKMRGAQGRAAIAQAVDAQDTHLAPDPDGPDLSFPLFPHPSHYLYPRSIPAAATPALH